MHYLLIVERELPTSVLIALRGNPLITGSGADWTLANGMFAPEKYFYRRIEQ